MLNSLSESFELTRLGGHVASFRTHISVAVVASASATMLCMQADLFTPQEVFVLFSLGVLAGILPDIDSDYSVPTRMLFKLLSVVAAALVVACFVEELNIFYVLGLALLAAFSVRHVVYPLFTSITEHRGLFHSLPAAMLFALSVVGIGLYGLYWSVEFSWLAAGFMCGGYLVHLLLDEFYSVDFMGRSLKESFGSALTIFSPSSWASYILLYMVVGLGVYLLPLPELEFIHTAFS